jgi:hypothetical protein
MPQEISQVVLEGAGSVLKWLGATSLASIIGFWTAWIAFPPELVIESVTDKSKKFNTESRIKIKNIGKLPAHDIECNVVNLRIRFGGFSIGDGNFSGIGSQMIHRLSGGESTETTVTPGMGFQEAGQISELAYTLVLEYSAKLFGRRKRFAKKWRIELRNFEDGFSWNWKPIK